MSITQFTGLEPQTSGDMGPRSKEIFRLYGSLTLTLIRALTHEATCKNS